MGTSSVNGNETKRQCSYSRVLKGNLFGVSLSEPHINELYGSRVATYTIMHVHMYVCSYIMSCSYVHLWYVRPLTDQPLIHLGHGIPSQCRVPKWSSTEMAAINYGLNIHHRQLQKRHSNETQRKLQTIPHKIIEAAKERILATTLPPKSKLSQVLEVYRVASTAVSSLFSFCIQLICSSHSHS